MIKRSEALARGPMLKMSPFFLTRRPAQQTAGDPHSGTALLRRTSVLRSKTLAQGQFTCPEHFQSPKGGATAGSGTQKQPPSGGRAEWRVNSKRQRRIVIGGIHFRREMVKWSEALVRGPKPKNSPRFLNPQTSISVCGLKRRSKEAGG